MTKNILVTGGAGYIGYSVINELLNNNIGEKIIIFDNFSKAKATALADLIKNEKIILIPGEKADIREEKNIEEAIKLYSPETIIHLAAKLDNFTKYKDGNDPDTEIINHKATVKLAEIAKKNGVKNFIFQSTVRVYKPQQDLVEESEKTPLYDYGKSKLLAENDLLTFVETDFNVAILRAAAVAGYNPCFRYETMINLMCINSVYKNPINIFQSAMNLKKSTLGINDNARAIIFALNNAKKVSGKPLNVSSFDCTIKEVLDILIEKLGNTFPYTLIEENEAKDTFYTLNTQKIRTFGFEPKDTLKETIESTINALIQRKSLEEKQL